MPVLSKCPMCRAIMPPAQKETRCPACGDLVIPAVRKLCARCGMDISRGGRIKDKTGEYYCEACWRDMMDASGDSNKYVCSTCGQLFPVDEVFQDGADRVICRGCLEEQESDPNNLLDVAAEMDTAPAIIQPVQYTGRRRIIDWQLVAIWAVMLGIALTFLVALITLVRRGR